MATLRHSFLATIAVTALTEEGPPEPGFRVDDKTWPHGGDAKGGPHGAVFSRRRSHT